MYYPSSENKGADQLRSNCEADLCLCFCIGKIRFSRDAALVCFRKAIIRQCQNCIDVFGIFTGGIWYGVDVMNEDIADNFEAFVWEPAIVKINALTAASEATCLILSVDETVRNPKAQAEGGGGGMGRGRGRPM